MPSPVRAKSHGQPHRDLAGWLRYYIGKTPGLLGYGDNTTVRLDEDNEFQPDLLLLLPPAMSTARIDEDDYVSGAPDLVCEIAASSVSIDLHAKMNAYRRNGVREYLVWRTDDDAVDWFVLREGRHEPLPLDETIVKSTLFPGLWLDPAALRRGDFQRLTQVLDQGSATPEHAAFVAKIKSGGN